MVVPELIKIPELPEEISQAALNGSLVLFVGAGASKLVNLPNWNELAWKVLNDLCCEGCLNYSELEQLKGLDPKKLLSIAEIKAKEKGINLDIAKHLRLNNNDNGIYKYINKIGCPCVTTNYDELLSPLYNKSKDGSTTPSVITRINQRANFYASHLNNPGTVVHLHGSVSEPDTMVFSTKQYLEHYDNEMVQSFLEELFAKKTILFLGYGLEEAEILEHILRRGKAADAKVRKRFLLQPFFLNQRPLYEMLYSYYLTLGVHLIGFVRDFKDYKQLEDIIKVWSEQIEVRPSPLAEDLEFMDEVLYQCGH